MSLPPCQIRFRRRHSGVHRSSLPRLCRNRLASLPGPRVFASQARMPLRGALCHQHRTHGSRPCLWPLRLHRLKAASRARMLRRREAGRQSLRHCNRPCPRCPWPRGGGRTCVARPLRPAVWMLPVPRARFWRAVLKTAAVPPPLVPGSRHLRHARAVLRSASFLDEGLRRLHLSRTNHPVAALRSRPKPGVWTIRLARRCHVSLPGALAVSAVPLARDACPAVLSARFLAGARADRLLLSVPEARLCGLILGSIVGRVFQRHRMTILLCAGMPRSAPSAWPGARRSAVEGLFSVRLFVVEPRSVALPSGTLLCSGLGAVTTVALRLVVSGPMAARNCLAPHRLRRYHPRRSSSSSLAEGGSFHAALLSAWSGPLPRLILCFATAPAVTFVAMGAPWYTPAAALTYICHELSPLPGASPGLPTRARKSGRLSLMAPLANDAEESAGNHRGTPRRSQSRSHPGLLTRCHRT